MKKLLQNHRYPLLLFGLITFICLFIFLPYLLGDTEFVLGWDMRSLYSSNFESLRNMLQTSLKTGELPFYSWSTFLGNDFYSSKLFYFQDIFDYPFALFTNWNYYTIIIIQTYLKFLVAGFSFYTYARYRKYSPSTAIIGSLIFAFSAYGLQTMMHPFFASFFVFLPLYFLTIDCYLLTKKKICFILIVAFMFINNYYLFYSVSLFSVLYFIFRYTQIHNTIKGFFLNALPLIGYYLIGFMISGFVVIPEVFAILANSRVGESSSFLVFESILPYLNYLSGLFTPTSVLANRNTAITPLYSFVSSKESVMAVFIWASSLSTLLVPQLFCKKNRKNIYLVALCVISAFALIPLLSSIMHGFSEPSFRWLQSPVFLMIVCILPLIETPNLIDYSFLKKTLCVVIVLMVLATPITAMISGHNFLGMIFDYGLILICIPFVILLYFSLIKGNFKFLICCLVAELSLVSHLSFIVSPYFSEFRKQTIQGVHNVLLNPDDYNEYCNGLDPKNATNFFRHYVDPSSVYWDMSLNLNLDFNIMGLISYDSTYQYSANDLKKIAPVESYLSWAFDIRNPDVMNLVSTKYAIVTDESQVPFNNYEHVGQFNYLLIYENKDYVNLGKTYTSLISYDKYQSNSSILTDTLIVNEKDRKEIQPYLGSEEVPFDTVTKSMNSIRADITTTEPGFAFISIPFDKGWKVLVNGVETHPYSVSGGMIGVPVNSGYNVIEMYFIPYGLKAGCLLSALGLLLAFIVRKIKTKSN